MGATDQPFDAGPDRGDEAFWESARSEVWRDLVGPDGYLPVFLLTLVSLILLQVDEAWRIGPAVSMFTVAAIVVMALVRSHVPKFWLRLTLTITALAVGLAVGRVAVHETGEESLVVTLSSTLFVVVVALSLPAVLRAAFGHRIVTVNTVTAAITAYLLFGLLFATIYRTVDLAESGAFFAQGLTESTSGDYVYFSFTTLTTVGYGDLSPGTDLGRGLANVEAVIGQIYLVTTVAILVSRLGQARSAVAAAAERAGVPPVGPRELDTAGNAVEVEAEAEAEHRPASGDDEPPARADT